MQELVYWLEIDLAGLVAVFFATCYLTLLLTAEPGPFDVFGKLRKLAGMEAGVYDHDQDTDEYVWIPVVDRSTVSKSEIQWREGDRFWSQVLSCHRCAAPYAAVVVLVAWYIFPPLVYVLAAGGATVALREN